MSSYYDDDRRTDDRRRDRDRGDRGDRKRDSRRRSPVYEEEEIIEARRGPKVSGRDRDRDRGALVPRRRDDSDSDSAEEIRRDFPPGGGSYDRRRGDQRPRRAKSARDSRRGGKYDDYDDYDHRRSRGSGRSKRDKRRDYSSSESESPSPRRDRRKSIPEQALAALGIGGALGAASGSGRSKSHDRSRGSDRRSRRYSDDSDSRSRSRGRGQVDQKEKIQAAVKAALIAGAGEAIRMRKEPGGWGGEKGKRVLTAAIGAGGINGLIDKDPNKNSTMKTIESVIGGLAGNRLINGSRKEAASRSRSRSRGRRDGGGSGGGLAGLGAAGIAAAAGKAFMDRNKSKDRGRSYSSSSDDGRRGGGRNRRSKSVSDYVRQGMGAIGLGGNNDKRDTTDRGSRRDLASNEYAPSRPRGGPGDYAPQQQRPRGGGGQGGDGIGSSRTGTGSNSSKSNSDDDESSSEEDRERKKLGHKQLITAGLASVATIHAAHNVYQSYHQAQTRREEVADGEMSPQDAHKKKNKARLQTAAGVGIAALGIKSAYGEWKEMKEQRDETKEFDHKRRERHERRLAKLEGRDHSSSTHSIDSPTMSGATTPGYGYGNPHGNPYVPAGYAAGSEQYRSSAPDLSSGYYGEAPGPHYEDGNPYHTAGLPPPPMGPPPERY